MDALGLAVGVLTWVEAEANPSILFGLVTHGHAPADKRPGHRVPLEMLEAAHDEPGFASQRGHQLIGQPQESRTGEIREHHVVLSAVARSCLTPRDGIGDLGREPGRQRRFVPVGMRTWADA